MGLSEKEIEETLKNEPLIRECAIKEEEDKICECGHPEKFHHNHKDYAWGVYSICRRCMACDWDEGCYEFKEKKGDDIEKEK